MAKIVQTITSKVNNKFDHEKALEGARKLKAGLAKHGIGVASHYSIEAGPASGYATLSLSYPSAAKWAEMVDSTNPELQELRQKMFENNADIVSTSLLQEVEL